MSQPRENIEKKIRFEVFKRDSFKCQYCGRSAPDIILEVDHIVPICGNGDSNIINLITSCFDCNRGKGSRLLSDQSALSKQRKQMEELEERRQQIELMMDWYKSQQDIETLELDKIVVFINQKFEPFSLNKTDINNLSKAIKKYELIEVLEAIDHTIDWYLDKSFNDFKNNKRVFIQYKLPKLQKLSDYKKKVKMVQKMRLI